VSVGGAGGKNSQVLNSVGLAYIMVGPIGAEYALCSLHAGYLRKANKQGPYREKQFFVDIFNEIYP